LKKLLRLLFFVLIVRLIVLIIIGLRISHKERLPKSGPAIIVANHNSHLDTLVLMALFPLRLLDRLRPVAAEDYWLSNPWLTWFSLNIIGIIPLKREMGSFQEHPLAACSQALDRGEILLIYPEGSRGNPESLGRFKTGIAHLAKRHPQIPIYPIFLHGLGKALPKGEALLVPFFCDVFIGNPLYWTENKQGFMDLLSRSMQELASEGRFPAWE
jgi:1-acyl-sn-glycerol-3-phosphate acyltransferase